MFIMLNTIFFLNLLRSETKCNASGFRLLSGDDELFILESEESDVVKKSDDNSSKVDELSLTLSSSSVIRRETLMESKEECEERR